MANSTNLTTEEELLHEDKLDKLNPIKSALRKSHTLNDLIDDTCAKPCIKRGVTFAPGLISGKSDVLEVVSNKDDEHKEDKEEKQNTNNFDDDENKLVLNSNNHLNFTNWRFGAFSASETSDDEKDFGKMNDKYKTWSRQYVKNEERKQKMEEKYKETVRKLRKSKAKIAKLKDEITEEESDHNSNSNSNQRKRRAPNKSVDDSYKKWKKRQNRKGVIYISSVPFGCTSMQLKKIFNEFGMVTNVHMEAAKGENGKKRKIHNKWTEFCESWIEFKDKKIAKQVAEILNETKIPKKYVKNRFAKNHTWSMKYLKGFAWHHLTEYKQTIRTLQRKKYEMKIADAQKQTAYFETQVRKAMEISNQLGNNTNHQGLKNQIDGFESSDDADNDEPPLKKQKLVEQRSGRIRRNHNRNKEILSKLMK